MKSDPSKLTNNMKIVSAEYAADADCLVAPRVHAEVPLIFPDNLLAPCHECGWMVQYRPTAPKIKNKLCMECARDHISADNHIENVTTQAAIDEFIAHKKG